VSLAKNVREGCRGDPVMRDHIPDYFRSAI
jgi:hypothetical protein